MLTVPDPPDAPDDPGPRGESVTSDAREPDTVILGSLETRASRRASREAALAAAATPDDHTREAEPIPVVTLVATLAMALLLAVSGLSATSGQLTTGLALAFAGLVLAWGWPTLLGSPSPRWSGVVVGIGGISVPATAGLTPDAEQLRWLPVSIGITLILCFLQQLLRTDRTRLTEGLAGTISGLAIATAGAPLAIVPVYRDGPAFLVAAMAAVAAGVLVEQLGRFGSVQRWVVAPVLLGGAIAAAAVALLTDGSLTVVAALLIGVLAAAISHALRRVMAVQPAAAEAPAALANGAASVLVVGVVVYLLTRVYVG